MSHTTHMNESRPVHDSQNMCRVVSLKKVSLHHFVHTWVTPHIYTSHAAHINESRPTHDSQNMRRVVSLKKLSLHQFVYKQFIIVCRHFHQRLLDVPRDSPHPPPPRWHCPHCRPSSGWLVRSHGKALYVYMNVCIHVCEHMYAGIDQWKGPM